MNSVSKINQFKITLSFLIVVVILLNCKKETTEECISGTVTIVEEHSFDTVYPSNYIMAYPGSWWEYDNGSIDSCFDWISQKTYISNRNGNCYNSRENIRFMPRTSFGIIKGGYSILGVIDPRYTTGYFPLTDTESPSGWIYSRRHNTQFTISISLIKIEKLDSFEVLGIMYHDIVHSQYSEAAKSKVTNPQPAIREYYFAKNIGIIQTSIYGDIFIRNFTDTARLMNHFIYPH